VRLVDAEDLAIIVGLQWPNVVALISKGAEGRGREDMQGGAGFQQANVSLSCARCVCVYVYTACVYLSCESVDRVPTTAEEHVTFPACHGQEPDRDIQGNACNIDNAILFPACHGQSGYIFHVFVFEVSLALLLLVPGSKLESKRFVYTVL
jgi:hypothetical protein